MSSPDTIQHNNIGDASAGAAVAAGGDNTFASSNGFGALTARDIGTIAKTDTINDGFSIGGTPEGPDSKNATPPNDSVISKPPTSDTTDTTPPDTTDTTTPTPEVLHTSPPPGDFDSHDLPDGKKMITFNPHFGGTDDVPAPIMMDKNGKIIENNSGGGGGGGGGNGMGSERPTRGFGYEDGSSVDYRQGDMHMTHTDAQGKSTRIDLKRPFNWNTKD